MTIQEAAARTYRIGRDVLRGEPKAAFSIRRRDDGGISLLNMREPPDSAERMMLFTHFGSPIDYVSGGEEDGEQYTEMVTTEAGSAEHFVAAIHALPAPFILLPSKG